MPQFTATIDAAASSPRSSPRTSPAALPAIGPVSWFFKVGLFRGLGAGLVIRGVTDFIHGLRGDEERWRFHAVAPRDVPAAIVALPEMWRRDP